MSLSQVVVVGGKKFRIIGLCWRTFHGLLFKVDRLLIIRNGFAVVSGLFSSVSLLAGRPQIGIAQPCPKQVSGCVHLGSFIQGVDRGIEIAGLHRCVGSCQLFIQTLDHVFFLSSLRLLLLHLLELFRIYALLLGSLGLGFLQIEIQSSFVGLDRKVVNGV